MKKVEVTVLVSKDEFAGLRMRSPYVRNEGPFTSFRVKGVAYEFRKRFAKNVDRGNILDVRHSGEYIGATMIDLPYVLRKEAREFIQRMGGCDCKSCRARRRKGLKP